MGDMELKDVLRGFGERVLTGVKKLAAKAAGLAAKVVRPPVKVAETPAKVTETPAKVTETPEKAAETAAKAAKPPAKTARSSAKVVEFFQTRRKPALIGLGVCAAILIFVLVFAFLGLRERYGRSRQNQLEPFSARGIPPEELVLPSEPDFLPEVLLEREQRESWTAEDARPFWTDPLDEGAEEYSKLMESVIDDLMERIP
jgi:hypothetical protein